MTKRSRTIGRFFLEEPHHGKMHEFLVPVLEFLFSCLDAPSVKVAGRQETLKTSSFSQPQTTHFHHFRRIRRNRLDTLNVRNPIQQHHPIPSLRGYNYVSQQSPKHPNDRLPNQQAELLGRSPFIPKQRQQILSRPVWACPHQFPF